MTAIHDSNKAKMIVWILKNYFLLANGTLIVAIAYTGFLIPHNIAPGGVTGIAMVLSHFIPLGVGLFSFLINIPLFLAGNHTMGWRFAIRSFFAMTMLSVFIDVLPQMDIAEDEMLATIFGGILSGVGLGITIRAGATTGGTDMAGRILHRLLGFLSVGTAVMVLDITVVLISGFVFGIRQALWALVTVYISSVVMDVVIKGFNTAVQFLIITSAADRIIPRIHQEMGRGCTRIYACGTFSGNDIGTLVCVVSRVEIPILRRLIASEDPNAFVTVSDVQQVLGEGFSQIQ